MIKELITIKILSEIDEEVANKAGSFANKLLTKKAEAEPEIKVPSKWEDHFATAGKVGAGAAVGAGILHVRNKIKDAQDQAHQDAMEREMQGNRY